MTPRFHFQVRIRERYKLLGLLGLGVLLAAVLIRQVGVGMEEQILSGGNDFFAALAQGEAEKEGLFVRLLWGRAWLPMTWIVLSFTAFGIVSLYLFWIYLGFAMTTALWVSMAFGGWRGPFYFWGLLFPQYLAYAPAFLLIYVGCMQWNRYYRDRRIPIKGIQTSLPQLRLFLLRIFLGLMLYLLGIYMESQWNPWILQKFFIKT